MIQDFERIALLPFKWDSIYPDISGDVNISYGHCQEMDKFAEFVHCAKL